jgi:glycosyltransferase involved in cell wall biosynthesis
MKNKNKSKVSLNKILPRVSICTPTFNRRPFFKGIISCVLSQDYPKDLLEWIIVDDGTDPIEDLIKEVPFVKYFKLDTKIPLGKKRNYMHDMCTFKNDTDIIVYMDDDDFYPSTRVSHSVERLINSKALCAGSSELHIWFSTLNKMYRFGPYGPNHATAGTFAFKRCLLNDTHYEDSAVLAEEKFFLKNYTIPFVQLDPLKTILVFSHEQNTFDKRRLIDPTNTMCKESSLKVKNFIKNTEIQQFYMVDIEKLLSTYEPGDIKHKQDVLDEIKRRDIERAQSSNLNVNIKNPDGTTRPLNASEIIEALKHKIDENTNLQKALEEKQGQLNKFIEIVKKNNLQSFFI